MTKGTEMAAKIRAKCNKLTRKQRERLLRKGFLMAMKGMKGTVTMVGT